MDRAARTTELVSWLANRPWTHVELPAAVEAVPTMLSREELAMLYVLARDLGPAAPEGAAIVDAGCFLGGSTAALARGLLDGGGGAPHAVHSYDLFELDDYAVDVYAPVLEGRVAGDSTRELFDRLLDEELRSIVAVHDGDVCGEAWDARPISVLFVDIAKTWRISDHVHRQFLPALVPGRSVLIQQDYVHEWTPWLHILMEALGDALQYVGTVPFASAIFVPTREISADEIPRDLFAEIDHERKLELFERSACRFSGEDRGVVECSRAVLLTELERYDEARRLLAKIQDEYGDHARVRIVRAWVLASLRKRTQG